MKAVIIGAGIMGLCSAYYLQQTGWAVSILDGGDLQDNCSYGNAGMIVPSHFTPLAAPGMVSRGIRWMFDSQSPFYIKPSLHPDLWRWGFRFLRSATQKHADLAAPDLCGFHLFSKQLYEELSQRNGLDFALEKKGIMMYYKTEKAGEEEILLAEKGRSLGLDVKNLSRAEAQRLEPNVRLDVRGAVHYRSDAHLDPNRLMEQLKQALQKAGATLLPGHRVTGFETGGGEIKKLITARSDFDADLVVMTGGSWLPALGRLAGLRIPLMPGKGYSITRHQPEKKLEIPAILCEAKVAITPMGGHMRYGGTMEIGPVNNRVNMTRVQGILNSIPSYFPEIRIPVPEPAQVWYGFRPCSPDGLPYLGRSKKWGNLLIAGGHAMTGISLGPASGKIISELANGHTPSIPIRLFEPGRFA